MTEQSPMRAVVLVSGGGTNLQAILDALDRGEIRNTRIEAVISSSKDAYALVRAGKRGIPAICIAPGDYENREAYNKALKREIDITRADLIVLAGFLVQVPPEIVDAYPNRIINIHPALIPSFSGKGYYGLHVHEAALRRGVKVSGATVHFVNADLDEGPIILQQSVAVEEGDTPETLQRRIMEQAEWKILPRAIDLIAAGAVSVDRHNHVIIKEDA